VTSLLGPVLAIILGVAPASAVFAPFANPIIFLFVGSFMLAQGMMEQGLDHRIALGILSLRWVGNSPYRLALAIAIIPLTISMWISDSATTAMIRAGVILDILSFVVIFLGLRLLCPLLGLM
jgi:sodium-dependent dicarboxylate transporter 2/3/5